MDVVDGIVLSGFCRVLQIPCHRLSLLMNDLAANALKSGIHFLTCQLFLLFFFFLRETAFTLSLDFCRNLLSFSDYLLLHLKTCIINIWIIVSVYHHVTT